MSVANLLAVVDGGHLSEMVVSSALEIGQQLDARTKLLHVSPPPSYVMYPSMEIGATQVVAEMISGLESRVEQRAQRFDDVVAEATTSHTPSDSNSGFYIESLKVIGHETREIARHGRLSDLVVMAIPDEDAGGVDSAALESALLDTGRPVLVLPAAKIPALASRVTVAWDGSRESAIAVKNAIPILRLASHVEVIHVARKKPDETDPADVVAYLESHGIEAQAETLVQDGKKVSDLLITSARDNGNAILVMGAYGQSAITEYVFGGVTRAVLGTARVPLLLSH